MMDLNKLVQLIGSRNMFTNVNHGYSIMYAHEGPLDILRHNRTDCLMAESRKVYVWHQLYICTWKLLDVCIITNSYIGIIENRIVHKTVCIWQYCSCTTIMDLWIITFHCIYHWKQEKGWRATRCLHHNWQFDGKSLGNRNVLYPQHCISGNIAVVLL